MHGISSLETKCRTPEYKRAIDEHELIQNSFHPIATKILLVCKLTQNIGERVQN